MSGLTDYLLESRTRLELAKELAETLKENVRLINQIGRLKQEVFWLREADYVKDVEDESRT